MSFCLPSLISLHILRHVSKRANYEDCRSFRIEILFFWCTSNSRTPHRYCKRVNPLETSCLLKFLSKNTSIHQHFSAKVASKPLPPPWLRTPPFAAADSMASPAAEALPETAVDPATIRWQLCARQSEICICEARGGGRFSFCDCEAKHNKTCFQDVIFSSNQIII